jgi:phospholipid transport system substrate-binding protein
MTQRSTRRSILKLGCLALVLSVVPRVAWAADTPGLTAVRQMNEAVSALLRRKTAPGSAEEQQVAADIKARLKRFLDIDGMGRRALVDHWNDLKEAERSEFTTLLRKLVEASYLKALRANMELDVRYLGESVRGDDHVVSTEVHAKHQGRVDVAAVDYVVHREGDDWRAIDLVTDGVGMIENYRAQFNKIIAQHGFAALLDKMKKKMDASG